MAYTDQQLEQIKQYVSEKTHSLVQPWLTEEEYNSGDYFTSPTGSFQTDKETANQTNANFNHLSEIACESINQISKNIIAKYGGILEPIVVNPDNTVSGIYDIGTVNIIKRTTSIFIYNLIKVGENVLAYERVDQSISLNDGTSINSNSIDYQNHISQVIPLVRKMVLNSGIMEYENSTIFGINESYNINFYLENFASKDWVDEEIKNYEGNMNGEFTDNSGTVDVKTIGFDVTDADNTDNTDPNTPTDNNSHRTDEEIDERIDLKLADYYTKAQIDNMFSQQAVNQLTKDTDQDNNIQALANGESITATDGTQVTMEGTDIAIEINGGTIVLEYDRDIVRSSGASNNLVFENVDVEQGDVLVLLGENTDASGFLRYLHKYTNGNSTTYGRYDMVFLTPRSDYSTMLEVKLRSVVIDNDGNTDNKYCGLMAMSTTGTKDISLKYSQGNGGNGSSLLSNAIIKVYKDKGNALIQALITKGVNK